MTRRPFLILLEFIAITVPLTWWWLHGGLDIYYGIFQRLGFPLLQEMGVNTFSPGLVRDRMISFVPFIALMLITPGLSWGRRFGGLAAGILFIFLSHVLLAYWAWVSFERNGEVPSSMDDFFPGMLAVDAFPFVVWAIFANQFLVEAISRVLPRSGSVNRGSREDSDTRDAEASQ